MIVKKGMHMSGLNLNGYGAMHGYGVAEGNISEAAQNVQDATGFLGFMGSTGKLGAKIVKTHPLYSLGTVAVLAMVLSPSARESAMSFLDSAYSTDKKVRKARSKAAASFQGPLI